MKYKLGEFVRFVNERREGFITRIIDENTIAVTDDDGFEIPVLASQVTRVHGKSDFTDVHANEESTLKQPEQFISNGIFLGIADDKRIGSVVHFNLINTSSWQVLFTLNTEKQHDFKGECSGILNPESTTQVYSASLNELDLWPKFHLQTLLYAYGKHEMQKPLLYSDKFKAKDFSGAKKYSSILGKEAWLIQIDSEVPLIDPQKLKESFFRPTEEKIEIPNPGKEVDLHIEKLRDDHQFLSSSEILDIQLNHFKKYLDAAIVHKLHSIIFIHGTGNGTLRNEIHKIISKHPQVKTFMDAYKEKFGYGATEIILK
ncbi:Smr domain-containing protein [Daejeonella rubra]|uniref:Smr domain-containing protein n=1 Tax=Daejeonella rubra TaxID=990371 RepID=A0A1G9S984_9SPHI|nr:Smr/MutS family protein [Daejeonella rubra]SDM31900.1 Smr domain-containing protein [Daejeonella rubra]